MKKNPCSKCQKNVKIAQQIQKEPWMDQCEDPNEEWD